MPLAIGVDQSANSTGVVVLDETGLRIAYALIAPPRGLVGVQRLVYVRDQLRDFMAGLPALGVGVREGYSLGSTHRPFLLGEIGGIVQLALHDKCGRVEECAPTELKKFVTGYGGATKAQVLLAVKQRWGYDYGDEDDLADAHGLARAGLVMLGAVQAANRYELEVASHKREKPPFQRVRRVVQKRHESSVPEL